MSRLAICCCLASIAVSWSQVTVSPQYQTVYETETYVAYRTNSWGCGSWWRRRTCYGTTSYIATRSVARQRCKPGYEGTTCNIPSQCASVQLVTRAEWGARLPRDKKPLKLPTNMTFIHHSDMSRCFNLENCAAQMRTIQNFHMDSRGFDDIGYSFLIGEDGRVYEGRGWTTLPSHSPTYNYLSHGMCFMGNFVTVAPLKVALDAAKAWIQCGVALGHIIPNYELFGHRDGRCTDCPGNMLYADIQTWPNYSFRKIPVYC